MGQLIKRLVLALLLLVAVPLAVRAAIYWSEDGPESWRTADWSSVGALPPARQYQPALVRIYSARTGRWKGIFATHSWIVIKAAGASHYDRFDKVGWGMPIRHNNYAPDGRWYSNPPVPVFSASGEAAERLIPKILEAIRSYPFAERGDYRLWPGPNSNTFVAAILAAVPEIGAALPPTAIGKDFPIHGRWLALTPSRTGLRLSLGGYFGLAIGWVEGIEINIFGAIVGLDMRRPAIKLPGIGRVGV